MVVEAFLSKSQCLFSHYCIITMVYIMGIQHVFLWLSQSDNSG